MNQELLKCSPDEEIVSARIVNFPRSQVYRAWTEPGHLANWWGPAGFTNTFLEHDLRPGGRWKFIMHGPEKGNYPNECEFMIIEKPSCLAWKRISKPLFQVVTTFEEISPLVTKIVFKMKFTSAEECNKIKRFAVDKNEENFDKLEQELKNMNEEHPGGTTG